MLIPFVSCDTFMPSFLHNQNLLAALVVVVAVALGVVATAVADVGDVEVVVGGLMSHQLILFCS